MTLGVDAPCRNTTTRSLSISLFRPEVAGNVISGVAVGGSVDVDVPVKFGDSISSRSRDIRLPYFVTDERRRRPTQVLTIGQNTLWCCFA